MITARGWLGRERRPASRDRIGSPKARVLPEPVRARPSTSAPACASGMTAAWTGVGSVMPALARAAMRLGSREAKIDPLGLGGRGGDRGLLEGRRRHACAFGWSEFPRVTRSLVSARRAHASRTTPGFKRSDRPCGTATGDHEFRRDPPRPVNRRGRRQADANPAKRPRRPSHGSTVTVGEPFDPRPSRRHVPPHGRPTMTHDTTTRTASRGLTRRAGAIAVSLSVLVVGGVGVAVAAATSSAREGLRDEHPDAGPAQVQRQVPLRYDGRHPRSARARGTRRAGRSPGRGRARRSQGCQGRHGSAGEAQGATGSARARGCRARWAPQGPGAGGIVFAANARASWRSRTDPSSTATPTRRPAP